VGFADVRVCARVGGAPYLRTVYTKLSLPVVEDRLTRRNCVLSSVCTLRSSAKVVCYIFCCRVSSCVNDTYQARDIC
jgi:hypothetical protein